MKIAILSISNRSTLPPGEYGYGGMTRVNWCVAEELARLGHTVTFFAAPGSKAPQDCTLALYPQSLCHHNQKCKGVLKATDKSLALWFGKEWLSAFDVIHESSHRHPIALFCDGPILATMHNPNTRKRWGAWTRNLVALSPTHAKKYRKREGGSGFVPWVLNGVRAGTQPFVDRKSEPFLLMGVMQNYKGVAETIQAAIEADVPLILAGTREGSPYYLEQCASLVRTHSNIEFVGEVQGDYKDNLVAYAKAAMLYVKWPEPGTMFGVEAMASGTPIIGSRRGCIPDYVIDGETGTLVNNVRHMAHAMNTIDQIEPGACYKRYLRYFTVEKQVQSYLKLYKRTAGGEQW